MTDYPSIPKEEVAVVAEVEELDEVEKSNKVFEEAVEDEEVEALNQLYATTTTKRYTHQTCARTLQIQEI